MTFLDFDNGRALKSLDALYAGSLPVLVKGDATGAVLVLYGLDCRAVNLFSFLRCEELVF